MKSVTASLLVEMLNPHRALTAADVGLSASFPTGSSFAARAS